MEGRTSISRETCALTTESASVTDLKGPNLLAVLEWAKPKKLGVTLAESQREAVKIP